jgi:hypothetical protein
MLKAIVSEGTEPQISLRLTLSVNIIFYGAGVATPDPGEAPPLAELNMRSMVAYNPNTPYLHEIKE